MGAGDTSRPTGSEQHPAAKRTDPRRAAAVVGVIVLGLLKAEAWGSAWRHVIVPATHHRSGAIVLLSLMTAGAGLHARALSSGVAGGALAAVVIRPGPIVATIGFGVAVCLLLLVTFYAVSTLLHIGQRRRTGVW